MDSQLAIRSSDAIARPQSFEALLSMADTLVKSGFLPVAIKTAPQAAAIMIAGREIGLTGMQSFRELYVVNGQVGMSTRLIVAFFKQQGGRYSFIERTPETCTVRLAMADGTEHDHTMTRKDADQMGITKEKNKETGQLQEKFNWRANPTGMLSNNCIKAAIRLWCPECLLTAIGPMELPEAEAPVVEVVEPENGQEPPAWQEEPDQDAPQPRQPRNPIEWAKGVQFSSKDGKVTKHWYLWPEFSQQFWAWAEKQALSPNDVCRFLHVATPDEIAELNLTPKEIVVAINEAIALEHPAVTEQLL